MEAEKFSRDEFLDALDELRETRLMLLGVAHRLGVFALEEDNHHATVHDSWKRLHERVMARLEEMTHAP